MQHQGSAEETDSIFFTHSKRPNWGLATVAYVDDDKTAFQFEDGKVRIFKKAYLQHLQPVDAPGAQSARTLARLGAQPENSTDSLPSKVKRAALPIDAQIMFFTESHPGGFLGNSWQARRRGVGAKRRLKRHRNPAVAEAQSFLQRDEMTKRMQAGAHAAIVESLVELLGGCDLVTKSMADDVAVVFEERAIPLVQALFEVLHGRDVSLAVRFERWYTELSRVCHSSPSWNLATAPLALALPDQHICVRIAGFLRQASSVDPTMARDRSVSGKNYQRWLSMAEKLRTGLSEAELPVSDSLDIHDFIVETLTPKSITRARELYRSRQ